MSNLKGKSESYAPTPEEIAKLYVGSVGDPVDRARIEAQFVHAIRAYAASLEARVQAKDIHFRSELARIGVKIDEQGVLVNERAELLAAFLGETLEELIADQTANKFGLMRLLTRLNSQSEGDK
jgi:hypothetical protein